MNGAPVDNLLARLEGVKPAGRDKWMARCPAHEDRQASLSVTVGADGRALVKCHAGCAFPNICASAGVKPADLYPPSNGNGHGHAKSNGNGRNGHHTNGNARIVKAYRYEDEERNLLYEIVRMSDKTFPGRRPDGRGGIVWGLGDVRRVLYRYPELLNAIEEDPDSLIIVAEGEKDVDRLREEGFVATTNPGGADMSGGNKKWRPEFTEVLRGRRVVLCGDNDAAGVPHMQHVAASLFGGAKDGAKEVRIVVLPSEWNGQKVKDPYDFFAAGGTKEDLLALIEKAPAYDAAGPSIQLTSFRVLSSRYTQLRPYVIDGMLREGETGNLVSTSKAVKTLTAIDISLAVCSGRAVFGMFATARGEVLYINNELHAETMTFRLKTVSSRRGILADEFADTLMVDNCRGRMQDIFSMGQFFLAQQPGRFKLVVLDALYRFYPERFDENSNHDMTRLYNRIDAYAEHLRSAFLIVHHSPKGTHAGKPITDVGAGAGSQSRACDSHLIIRPHEQEGCAVLEGALRSWAPLKPIGLRWEFPIWTPDDSLDTSQLQERAKKPSPKTGPTQKPEKPIWTPESFTTRFLSEEPKSEASITCAAKQADLSERYTSMLLKAAIEAGLAHRWTYRNPNEGHRFATEPQPVTATEAPEDPKP